MRSAKKSMAENLIKQGQDLITAGYSMLSNEEITVDDYAYAIREDLRGNRKPIQKLWRNPNFHSVIGSIGNG